MFYESGNWFDFMRLTRLDWLLVRSAAAASGAPRAVKKFWSKLAKAFLLLKPMPPYSPCLC